MQVCESTTYVRWKFLGRQRVRLEPERVLEELVADFVGTVGVAI